MNKGCRCDFDNPVGAVTIVPYSRTTESILLAKRASEPFKGEWDTIGGYMQGGEYPFESAIREFKEETGITLSENDLLHVAVVPAKSLWEGETFSTIEFIYSVELDANRPLYAQDDVSYLQWFPLVKPPSLPMDGPRAAVKLVQEDHA